MTDLIEGRFVRLACPWCGAATYAVPGVPAMACASHGRAWFGATEPARPTPGENNSWVLGQLGANAYPHTPRAVTGLEGVVRPVPPFVVVPRRAVLPVDGAPSSVGLLARREGGAAFYVAALWREGAETTAAGRTQESGKVERVPTPPLDRWVLEEQVVVVWDRPDERGFRIWRRRGRSGWTVRCTWRRSAEGLLALSRGAG